MAVFTALIPLIIALLPLMEKAIEFLIQHRQNPTGLAGGERRIGRVMHLCSRLRETCERLQTHGATAGVQATEEE